MSHIRIVPRVITGTPQGLSPGYQRQEYCNRSKLLALIIREVAAGPSGPSPPERRYRPLPATAASPAARRPPSGCRSARRSRSVRARPLPHPLPVVDGCRVRNMAIRTGLVSNSPWDAGLLQSLPHPHRGGGHVDVGYPLVRECIHDRVYDRRLGGYGPRFPMPFTPIGLVGDGTSVLSRIKLGISGAPWIM
jgi:hypothetical protein